MDIFLILPLVILVIFLIFAATAIYSSFSGAPWIPLKKKDIKRCLELADIKPGDLVYDLGCGDGRLVIAAAKHHNCRAIGIEFSILQFLIAHLKVWFAGLSDRVEIKYKNFFKEDLSAADVVFCFLLPFSMTKLGHKFRHELQPDSKVISYTFSIRGWKADKIDRPEKKAKPIYLYKI